MTYSDGHTYQGEWLQDNEFGKGLTIWTDGRKFLVEWRMEDKDSWLKEQKRKN